MGLCLFLRNFAGRIDGGSRTEAEERVYSWLYTLAQAEKDLVFEYVRSTERGECISCSYLKSSLIKP